MKRFSLRRPVLRFFALLGLPLFAAAGPAFACDLCAVYNAVETQRGGSAGSGYFGAAHQLTYYESGVKPPELSQLKDQYITSNITQFFLGYWLNERLALQANLPLIERSYRRISHGRNESGSERGLGDAALLARAVPYRLLRDELVVHTEIFGGVKFPTGDSDPLKRELDEVLDIIQGHTPDEGNLVGGDDLALGSGSTDAVAGASLLVRYSDLTLSANAQYALRNEGDFHYRYGNDLQWDAGPGYFALLEHDRTLLVRARLAGHYQAEDEILGVELDGSADRALFLGPELIYTSGDKLAARAALELPLHLESAAEQVVPRLRILASLSWTF